MRECCLSSVVEHFLGKEEVTSSRIPSAPTSNSGSAPSNGSATPESAASGVIHRGFTSIDRSRYRNHTRCGAFPSNCAAVSPELQIFCDPSHIGGARELVAPLAQQAMDLGFDGLFVESHCRPDEAWSDKAQQITPQTLTRIVRQLVIRETATTTNNPQRTAGRNRQARRPAAGTARRADACGMRNRPLQKEHGMPVLQTRRYEQLLSRRTEQAAELGMDREFMRSVLRAIHEESIRQQMRIIDEK